MLGDFNDAQFNYARIISRFFRRDGKYLVRTDGYDGKPADFEVKYTFGVTPLQQYLVEFPGGRYQALSIAWDARPKGQGGQRWFHLYPNEKIDHKDPLHSPNACTQCHADRKADWAAAAMDKWYGQTWRQRQHYGTTLHGGVTQGAKALPALLALARDQTLPSIVRASAATLAQPHVQPGDLQTARRLLADPDPATRIAALGLIERFETTVRVEAGAPLLGDIVRGVRIEAARMLADVPDERLSPDQQRGRELALKEYMDALALDADWPAANASLGNLYMRQGKPAQAIAAYERALVLDPHFAGAYVNLAVAFRQQGRENDGEKVLRRGLAVLSRPADLHHALGLLRVRKGDKAAALKDLAEASRLAPDNARYAYVYAVGLHSAGKRVAALAQLRAADARHPYDLEILGALVSMNREAGKPGDALPYAGKIAEVLPEDPGVKRLVTELEGMQR